MEDSNTSIKILITFSLLVNLISIPSLEAEGINRKLTVTIDDGFIYYLPTDDKPYRNIDMIFPFSDIKKGIPEYAYDSGKSDFRYLVRPNHYGTDLFAPTGTIILAPADGRVIMSVFTPNRGPGNKIAIYHGGGVYTYYLHMERRLVMAGDYVEKGEPIATVGNTGNASSTPPHLHFEIDLSLTEQRKPNWFTTYINYMPFPGVVHLHSIDPLAYIVSKSSE
ncbi:MAG: M23 family metallopeptidase [bacterium]